MAEKKNRERSTIEVTTRRIRCSFDHPVVYYIIGDNNEIRCDYCNIKYVYKNKEKEYASTIP